MSLFEHHYTVSAVCGSVNQKYDSTDTIYSLCIIGGSYDIIRCVMLRHQCQSSYRPQLRQ